MKSIISILAVLLFSAFSIAPNQSHVISGIVKDEAGNPLPGVSVVVKGTSNGTVTDMNGAYPDPGKCEAKYLVFTYIGMEPREVKIAQFNRINVIMKSTAWPSTRLCSQKHEPVKSYEMNDA